MEGKVHIDVELEDDYNSDDGSIHSIEPLDESFQLPPAPSKKSIQERMKAAAEALGKDPPIKMEVDEGERFSALKVIPEKIWAEIFSLLHPRQLAELRGTCRDFDKYLNSETIWRRSRKVFFPDMPRPVFGLKEWEMFRLARGKGCMVCKGAKATNIPPQTIWQFRVRCCKPCLIEHTTKESEISRSHHPKELYNALTFIYMDANGVIYSSPPAGVAGIHKVFWDDDIKSIRERYEEAKDMNADEEWLKGLDLEAENNRLDLARVAKWEARKTHIEGSRRSRNNNNSNVDRGAHAQQTQQQHQFHTMSATGGNPPSVSPGIIGPGYPPPPFANLQPPQNQRVERSAVEVAELRRKRQLEIVARCSKLVPPISEELLNHMPAYRAATIIARPLTDRDWEILAPKLQEQRQDAEEQERRRQEGLASLHRQTEERRAQDLVLKEVKEKTEKEWEEVQTPVREELLKIADDIVRSWSGRLSKETAAQFAADVLIQTRAQYYQRRPYSAEDPEHRIPIDPSAPGGAVALERPMANRLVLENMKYVFDMKIKPLTDQYTKELFLCYGCHNNPKFYGFEGVIQHYAAKHTTKMTLGSTIVHWKASWPFQTPFHPNPSAVRHSSGNYPMIGHNRNMGRAYTVPSPAPQLYPQPAQPLPMRPLSHGSSPMYGSPYVYPPPPLPQHSQHPPRQSVQPPPMVQPGIHQQPYTEELVRCAREAWFQLNGIKDLPSSVRVHFMIHKVAAFFQMRFKMDLDFNLFDACLKDHPLMKPIKNVNGLQCMSCTSIPPGQPGFVGQNRVFTLLALLSHFDSIHVRSNPNGAAFDWKHHMVKLPDPSAISAIRDAPGMDQEKLRLLSEVFPYALTAPQGPPLYHAYPPSAATGLPSRPLPMTNTPSAGYGYRPIVNANHGALPLPPSAVPPPPPPLPAPPQVTKAFSFTQSYSSTAYKYKQESTLPPVDRGQINLQPPPPFPVQTQRAQLSIPERSSGGPSPTSLSGLSPNPLPRAEPVPKSSNEKAEQFLQKYLSAANGGENSERRDGTSTSQGRVDGPAKSAGQRQSALPVEAALSNRRNEDAVQDSVGASSGRSSRLGAAEEREKAGLPPRPAMDPGQSPPRSPRISNYSNISATPPRNVHRPTYPYPPPPPAPYDASYVRGRSRSPSRLPRSPPPSSRYTDEDRNRREYRDRTDDYARDAAMWHHSRTPPHLRAPYPYPPPVPPPIDPYRRYDDPYAEYRAAHERAYGSAYPPPIPPPPTGYYDVRHHYPPPPPPPHYYDERPPVVPHISARGSPPPMAPSSRIYSPPPFSAKSSRPRPDYLDQESANKRPRNGETEYYPPGPSRDQRYR